MDALQELANAEGEQLARWERRVESLIQAKGGNVSAREFQRAVNVVFHDIEATQYDELHREMWDSLQPIYDRLASDVQKCMPDSTGWTLADVGCGTGLATQFILQTTLKSRISSLMMVDTSSVMLLRCRDRASSWSVPTEFINDQIEALPNASADVLVTCSVLHHLPDLVGFCQQVGRVVKPGGCFIHLQDPRRGATDSTALSQRAKTLRTLRGRPMPSRAFRAAVRRLRGLLKPEDSNDYLDEVNRRLIDAQLIKKPLAPREIWSITDLREGDLPYSAADGICIQDLTIALGSFKIVDVLTYGFFGVLPSHLPETLLAEERRLMDEGSGDGVFLSGVWKRHH